MKKIIPQSTLAGIAGVASFFILSSFLLMRGGDSYTISLNGKQMIQHYVHSKEAIPSLSLSPGTDEVIAVYYSECGKIGTSRKLTIRDDKNSILKEWKFVDSKGEHTPMTINSSDIVVKGSASLYYESATVSESRKLVTLTLDIRKTASR